MKVISRKSEVLINGVRTKMEDVVGTLKYLPSGEIVSFFRGLHMTMPRQVRMTALHNVLDDKVKQDDIASKFTDEVRYRMKWFHTFSEYQLENVLYSLGNVNFENEYREELWLTFLKLNDQLKIDDEKLAEVFEMAKGYKNSPREGIMEFNRGIDSLFFDESGKVDGLEYADFRAVLKASSTLNELREIGTKYEIEIPRRIKKNELADIILDEMSQAGTLDADTEARIKRMSVMALQRFAKDNKIKASTELKKEDIIEYIIARVETEVEKSNVNLSVLTDVEDEVEETSVSPEILAELERIRVEKEALEQALEDEKNAKVELADKVVALEQAEAERLAAEQAEAERIAAEQAEAERLAAEQAEAERIAAEQAEAERLAAEKAALEEALEAERLEKEALANQLAEKEREEAERLAAEQAEAERLAAEQAEAERLAAEQAEAERIAAEKAALEEALEAERLEKEALAKKLEAERLEKERIAFEKEEAERLAKEKEEFLNQQIDTLSESQALDSSDFVIPTFDYEEDTIKDDEVVEEQVVVEDDFMDLDSLMGVEEEVVEEPVEEVAEVVTEEVVEEVVDEPFLATFEDDEPVVVTDEEQIDQLFMDMDEEPAVVVEDDEPLVVVEDDSNLTFESDTFEAPLYDSTEEGDAAVFDNPTFDTPIFEAPIFEAPVYGEQRASNVRRRLTSETKADKKRRQAEEKALQEALKADAKFSKRRKKRGLAVQIIKWLVLILLILVIAIITLGICGVAGVLPRGSFLYDLYMNIKEGIADVVYKLTGFDMHTIYQGIKDLIK